MAAALSDTLPRAVLLGQDVPELNQLLGGCMAREPHDTTGKEEVLMDEMRKRRKLEEKLQEQGQEMKMEQQVQNEAEAATQVQDDAERPKRVTELEAVQEDAETERQNQVQDLATVLPEDPWKDGLDDELLEGGRVRRRMSKAQKRQEWRKFWQHGKGEGTQNLNFELPRQLQHTDESLAKILQLVKDGHPEKDSLVSRGRQRQSGLEAEGKRKKQLVPPKKCREAVLRMAHKIPMAGLGKLFIRVGLPKVKYRRLVKLHERQAELLSRQASLSPEEG